MYQIVKQEFVHGSKVLHLHKPDPNIKVLPYNIKVEQEKIQEKDRKGAKKVKRQPPTIVDLQQLAFCKEFIESDGNVDPTANDFFPHVPEKILQFGGKILQMIKENEQYEKEVLRSRHRCISESPYYLSGDGDLLNYTEYSTLTDSSEFSECSLKKKQKNLSPFRQMLIDLVDAYRSKKYTKSNLLSISINEENDCTTDSMDDFHENIACQTEANVEENISNQIEIEKGGGGGGEGEEDFSKDFVYNLLHGKLLIESSVSDCKALSVKKTKKNYKLIRRKKNFYYNQSSFEKLRNLIQRPKSKDSRRPTESTFKQIKDLVKKKIQYAKKLNKKISNAKINSKEKEVGVKDELERQVDVENLKKNTLTYKQKVEDSKKKTGKGEVENVAKPNNMNFMKKQTDNSKAVVFGNIKKNMKGNNTDLKKQTGRQKLENAGKLKGNTDNLKKQTAKQTGLIYGKVKNYKKVNITDNLKKQRVENLWKPKNIINPGKLKGNTDNLKKQTTKQTGLVFGRVNNNKKGNITDNFKKQTDKQKVEDMVKPKTNMDNFMKLTDKQKLEDVGKTNFNIDTLKKNIYSIQVEVERPKFNLELLKNQISKVKLEDVGKLKKNMEILNKKLTEPKGENIISSTMRNMKRLHEQIEKLKSTNFGNTNKIMVNA